MSFEYWYATSPEGRVIRYGYKELSDGVAAISATVEGRSVMILQRSLRAPLTRAQVEALFEENYTVRNLTGEECRSRPIVWMLGYIRLTREAQGFLSGRDSLRSSWSPTPDRLWRIIHRQACFLFPPRNFPRKARVIYSYRIL